MKRRFLFTALSFLLFVVGLTSFSFRNDNTGIVHDVLRQTNQFRTSKGLPEPVICEELNTIAQQHSEDMASGRQGFGHDGFADRNEMANKIIRSLHSFGENVAYGATTGKQVVTMWKNSPGHRRNLLGPYKFIGVGVAKDNDGQIFYTQIFAG